MWIFHEWLLLIIMIYLSVCLPVYLSDIMLKPLTGEVNNIDYLLQSHLSRNVILGSK